MKPLQAQVHYDFENMLQLSPRVNLCVARKLRLRLASPIERQVRLGVGYIRLVILHEDLECLK